MKFCSNSVVKDRKKSEVINIASPACHLITTKQFLEAFSTGFENYEFDDLHAAAKRILKIQMYQLYRLAKTSHALIHTMKTNFVSQKFYDVTPENFEPSNEEIQSYLKKPKFIFRYSIWNLNAICRIFEVPKLTSQFTIQVKTVENDTSQIVPYLKSKYLVNPKKNLFKTRKSETIDYTYVVETFNKYFKYNFKDHETIEYLYSDDFHIHGLGSYTTYTEFICAMLTGFYHTTTNGESNEVATILYNDLNGIKMREAEKFERISSDPIAKGIYKKQLKEKKQVEKRDKNIHKQTIRTVRKEFSNMYKTEAEEERKIRKAKEYQHPDDVPKGSFGYILKSGFDSVASNSIGRMARKNAFINKGISIASETVDNVHRQAMKTVERTLKLKRKRSVIFGDETEEEANAEYEDQTFLREYISEREPDLTFIPNGVHNPVLVPDFNLTDYVGDKVLAEYHPIADHLMKFAENRRKNFMNFHPIDDTDEWVGELLKSDPLSFYSFILKLLGPGCAVEKTEVLCNFGHFPMREPWKLPLPENRLEFIKKSYCEIVPENSWIPALSFDYKNNLSEKKVDKILAVLDSYIIDYHLVFDVIDDANKQAEIVREEKKKARAEQIEIEKQKRIEQEKIQKANCVTVKREIDHLINDINYSYDENDENQVLNRPPPAQFQGLFNEAQVSPVSSSVYSPTPTVNIAENASVDEVDHEVDHDHDTSSEHVTLARRLTRKLSRGITRRFSRKSAESTIEVDDCSIVVHYDSDIENEELYQSKTKLAPPKDLFVEKPENFNPSKHNYLKKNSKPQYTENQIKLHKELSSVKEFPRWSKAHDTTLPIKFIGFNSSGTRYKPKLYLSTQREHDPRFRRYDAKKHAIAKLNAIVDNGPYISRPEMSWCIISGLKDNHAVGEYLQRMEERYTQFYQDEMSIINRSNVDFRYLEGNIKTLLLEHNKNTPNFLDLRIIPFPRHVRTNDPKTVKWIAYYLEYFFIKHNSQSVINTDAYREQLLKFILQDKSHADALFTYAKDCFLYEINIAASYVEYTRNHLSETNEFLSENHRVGTFDLFNSEFDRLYVHHYKILDSSFSDVYDYTLSNYLSLKQSGHPCDDRWFTDDPIEEFGSNPDNEFEINSTAAVKFGICQNLGVITHFKNKFGNQYQMHYSNGLKC